MKLLVIDIQKGITDSRLFNFDEFIDNTYSEEKTREQIDILLSMQECSF